MDLQVQMSTQRSNLRFSLSNLGENKAILGYPWLATVQPRIDWNKGWIDHTQLPIILRAPDTVKAWFIPQQINTPRRDTTCYYIWWVAIYPGDPPNIDDWELGIDPCKVPLHHQKFNQVFSKEALHELPPSRIWDHAIELKPGAPASLPRKLIPLSQAELREL